MALSSQGHANTPGVYFGVHENVIDSRDVRQKYMAEYMRLYSYFSGGFHGNSEVP